MPYISRSYFHPVSKSYFDKIEQAGGTVQDKNSINNFVTCLSRIIDPQFWVCWPLRSSQNIGTGTTAFSLGGLGNFPGTLTNGPTWGANGISFVLASSQRIILENTLTFLNPGEKPFTIASSYNTTSGVTSATTLFGKGPNHNLSNLSWALRSTSAQNGQFQVTNGVTQVIPSTATSTVLYGTSAFSVGNYDKINARVFVNNLTNSDPYTENLQNSTSLASIGSANDRNFFNGSISFCIFIYGIVPPLILTQIYKQTLGQGLNLL